MTNQAEYMRRRREAIKAGTWEPHRAADPTLVPTPADWAWAAGFLEGEGSFVDSGTSPRVYAPQKDPEALERLLALFGGSVRQQVNGRATPIYQWAVNGEKARAVIAGVYPFLTARRREQADRALRGA
jgi:hypothetical protein